MFFYEFKWDFLKQFVKEYIKNRKIEYITFLEKLTVKVQSFLYGKHVNKRILYFGIIPTQWLKKQHETKQHH